MNMYYNFGDPAQPGVIVDAIPYNFEMNNITAAFDLLPPSVQLMTGTLTYSHDSGTSDHKVATSIYGSGAVAYQTGEQVQLKIDLGNTTICTLSINDRDARPIIFDVFGGSVGDDLKPGGIYSFVFDGSRMWCLELSTRYLRMGLVSVNDALAYQMMADDYNAMCQTALSRAEYIPGSVEFFDDDPNTIFPGTLWEKLTDMIFFTDTPAWIRRS